jgi:predicted dehydrogenase
MSMFETTLSRRGFLARSMSAMLATGIPAWFANETLASVRESAGTRRRLNANSKLTLGLIGSGDRSKSLIGPLIGKGKHAEQVQWVAVCDVDTAHMDARATQIGTKVDKIDDYRKLCDRKDIDAVLIVTPDHWHAAPAITAAKAKKDIYIEKPLTLTIAEGQPIIKAVRGNQRILQVGSQQRSEFGGKFRLAVELARNGRLGKIKEIRTAIGGSLKGGPFKEEAPPATLNWDFWQGQTPAVPYIKERCHYQFRWWYEYSGGKGTDWGAHHNDIAQWVLDMDNSGPIRVESNGEAPNIPNGYNCHTKFEIVYTYANGVQVVCTSDGDNGVKIIGEKGWIFVSRGKIDASDKKLLEEPLPDNAIRVYQSNDHMGNWLESVKSRKDPVCTAEVGHRSVTVCHLGNISLRLGGRKLSWDPKQETIVGDADAAKMLSREQRSPYKLPEA